jgi:hypothetical protein
MIAEGRFGHMSGQRPKQRETEVQWRFRNCADDGRSESPYRGSQPAAVADRGTELKEQR